MVRNLPIAPCLEKPQHIGKSTGGAPGGDLFFFFVHVVKLYMD